MIVRVQSPRLGPSYEEGMRVLLIGVSISTTRTYKLSKSPNARVAL